MLTLLLMPITDTTDTVWDTVDTMVDTTAILTADTTDTDTADTGREMPKLLLMPNPKPLPMPGTDTTDIPTDGEDTTVWDTVDTTAILTDTDTDTGRGKPKPKPNPRLMLMLLPMPTTDTTDTAADGVDTMVDTTAIRLSAVTTVATFGRP